MLYHDATILVGLVYTSMLFMVVPLVERAREPRRFADRGRLRPGRQRLVDPAADRHSARRAGHRRGLIVVFMLTLGNYLTPTLLGGKNSLWFTEQIYTQFITRFNWEQGAAFGFLLLVLSTAIVWLGLEAHRPALRRRDEALVIPSLPRRALSRATRPRRYVAAFFVFLFVPLAVVAVFAFNDAQLSGAAVARLHARLVRRRRRRGGPGSSPTRRC